MKKKHLFCLADLEFLFADEVDCHVTQTFLESLTDTFEQNKQEIYEILTILPKEKLYLEVGISNDVDLF